jgi:hypothetical protein
MIGVPVHRLRNSLPNGPSTKTWVNPNHVYANIYICNIFEIVRLLRSRFDFLPRGILERGTTVHGPNASAVWIWENKDNGDFH